MSDIRIINIYKDRLLNGISEKEAMKEVWATSRDNARTPMQWTSGKNAGFTLGKPWIKINNNFKDINVEKQEEDKDSILNFYKKLIKIRNNSETLIYGSYDLILEEDENIFAYTRKLNNEKYIIITNLTNKNAKYIYDKDTLSYENLVINNYEVEKHDDINEFILKPYECRVYFIK